MTEVPGKPEAGRTGRHRNTAAAAQAAQASMLDDLVAANNESNKTMLHLVESVREETKARDRKVDALARAHRQMQWVTGLVCVLIVVLLVFAVINAFTLNSNGKTAQGVATTNQTLLDCLNSRGVCGKANAAKQEEILQAVKQYELTGFYCARTNPANVDPKGEDFLKCMDRLYPGGPTLTNR